jgi:hypothetical protein
MLVIRGLVVVDGKGRARPRNVCRDGEDRKRVSLEEEVVMFALRRNRGCRIRALRSGHGSLGAESGVEPPGVRSPRRRPRPPIARGAKSAPHAASVQAAFGAREAGRSEAESLYPGEYGATLWFAMASARCCSAGE